MTLHVDDQSLTHVDDERIFQKLYFQPLSTKSWAKDSQENTHDYPRKWGEKNGRKGEYRSKRGEIARQFYHEERVHSHTQR